MSIRVVMGKRKGRIITKEIPKVLTCIFDVKNVITCHDIVRSTGSGFQD
jgi:hypothetical protein